MHRNTLQPKERSHPKTHTAGLISDAADGARFLRAWIDRPLTTGAIAPSGQHLARMMASYVDPTRPGPVIELGPGTGSVTAALIARGVAAERLVLIEFDPEFCALLKERYPSATVIEGDAYRLGATLGGLPLAPAAAVVSSLPLFTHPPYERLALLHSAFGLMAQGAPFIQFTYAAISPIPLLKAAIAAELSPRVWLNLPPARVWVYREDRSSDRVRIIPLDALDLVGRIRERTERFRADHRARAERGRMPPTH